MEPRFSRRDILLAAGGVTFLALKRVDGGYVSTADSSATPAAKLLYTAAPYIQPGPASKLVDGGESTVIAWQTEARPAKFAVTFGANGSFDQQAQVALSSPYLYKRERDPINSYTATLSNLKLGTKYEYRVTQDGAVVAEGYFTTRKPRGAKMRFVSFGDNSYGEPGQRAIAFHAYGTHPDFVMNTGDNVYDGGLYNEYKRHFFPVYNSDVAAPSIGSPLLRSVPFYTVMANHDVEDKGPNGNPVADFDKNPDNFGYFTVMNLPANGIIPPQAPPMVGKAEVLKHFSKEASRYPRQAVYSFDFGEAHFLCLDSNIYVDTTDKRWHDFVSADLSSTDAKWKFVVFHHGAFNVGTHHYKEQHMRLFQPLFEKHGVDFVLNGHEHNYQRTMPLRFKPAGPGQAANLNSKNRLVPGEFTIDTAFDGKTHTKANGVIHIVTGAGGKHLYDEEFHDAPAKWVHPEDGNVAYVSRLVADRHSFTVFDIGGDAASVRQIDEWGQEVDAFKVTKG